MCSRCLPASVVNHSQVRQPICSSRNSFVEGDLPCTAADHSPSPFYLDHSFVKELIGGSKPLIHQRAHVTLVEHLDISPESKVLSTTTIPALLNELDPIADTLRLVQDSLDCGSAIRRSRQMTVVCKMFSPQLCFSPLRGFLHDRPQLHEQLRLVPE